MPEAQNSRSELKEALRVFLEIEKIIRSLRSALNSWVYGNYKASLLKTGDTKYAEEIAKENAKAWIKYILRWKSEQREPYLIIQDYLEELEKRLLVKRTDYDISKKDGKSLQISIKGSCIYQDSCKWAQNENLNSICPRATILEAVIESESQQSYNTKILEKKIGTNCVIEISPKNS